MIYNMSVYGDANIPLGSHFLMLAKHRHCCATWPKPSLGEPNILSQPRIMTPKGRAWRYEQAHIDPPASAIYGLHLDAGGERVEWV